VAGRGGEWEGGSGREWKKISAGCGGLGEKCGLGLTFYTQRGMGRK
jgi:hypothetical protein